MTITNSTHAKNATLTTGKGLSSTRFSKITLPLLVFSSLIDPSQSHLRTLSSNTNSTRYIKSEYFEVDNNNCQITGKRDKDTDYYSDELNDDCPAVKPLNSDFMNNFLNTSYCESLHDATLCCENEIQNEGVDYQCLRQVSDDKALSFGEFPIGAKISIISSGVITVGMLAFLSVAACKRPWSDD